MDNFFEQQDEARRSTFRLVLLFGLAVVLIIAALYLLFWFVAGYSQEGAVSLWQPDLFFTVTLGGLLVIGAGSLTKSWSLRQGGNVVAEELGGHLLDRESTNPEERRLLNVVEEMAIASGVPVPPVYLLSGEDGINAFAAGFSPDDAVVGVTRGCLEKLTREELQGVIAHEYSHILNGDMGINIRLIGLLHGILIIGLLGRLLMHSAAWGHHGRSHERDGRGQLAMLLAGLGLFAVGSAGFFCGRLIKSAVSRKREYLADASAVQFTRNPNGIAGALKKIGGYEKGGYIESPNAEENSHLFFGYALGEGFFSRVFSTHPPLEERIRRLEPSFEGDPARDREQDEAVMAGLRDETITTQPEFLVGQVGTLSPEHLSYGAAVRRSIPTKLSHTVHEPFGAVAITYGLLLDTEEALREKQWQVLEAECPPALLKETKLLFPHIKTLNQKLRLPLMEMAAPALRELSPDQRTSFAILTRHLVNADERLSVFEYALQKILQRRLATTPGRPLRQRRHRSLSHILPDAATLLSALARVGHTRDDEVNQAFQAGIECFDIDEEERIAYQPSVCSFRDLDRALSRLRDIKPMLKEQVLNACAHCVLMDNIVTVQEAELLRALAIALDCPLPPFLPAAETAGEA